MKRTVLVLAKRTSFQKLAVAERDPRVLALLDQDDVTVARMRLSHRDHTETLDEVASALKKLDAEYTMMQGPRSSVDGHFDLVVTVGGDGTLLAASHQIGPSIPLLGVNSAPNHSVGFFCATRKGEVLDALAQALDGTMAVTELARMRVDLGGQCLHARVLNEALFCHSSPAATSRYILRIHDGWGTSVGGVQSTTPCDAEEEQRSSGLWVGPAAGLTAAQRSAGGELLPLTSQKIQFVVREPYTPVGAPLKFARGLIEAGGVLEIRNKMRDAKIFVDGHHTVFDSTIGDVITMRRSDETLSVLGLSRNRRTDRPPAPP